MTTYYKITYRSGTMYIVKEDHYNYLIPKSKDLKTMFVMTRLIRTFTEDMWDLYVSISSDLTVYI